MVRTLLNSVSLCHEVKKKMLSGISEPQPLQGHRYSLVGPRVTKIELVMDDYTVNYHAHLVVIDKL